MVCPWCSHMSLMEDITDDEVAAEKLRRSTKHAEDVAKHDQLPPGLKKKREGRRLEVHLVPVSISMSPYITIVHASIEVESTAPGARVRTGIIVSCVIVCVLLVQ